MVVSNRRNPGKPGGSAAAQKPHNDSFSLVVEGMSQCNFLNIVGLSGGIQKSIPPVSGLFFKGFTAFSRGRQGLLGHKREVF